MTDARNLSDGPVDARATALARRFDWTAEAGISVDEVGVITRLLRIEMFVSEQLEALVAPHDLSVADYMVLASIRRGCTSPAELCRVLRRTTGGMTLTIDRLIAAGYVLRDPDPSDRRRIVVTLSPEGLRKTVAIHEALRGWEHSLGFTEAERDRIGDVLDEVAAVITPDDRR